MNNSTASTPSLASRARALRGRTILLIVALAAAASLIWTAASPAGSYMPSLQTVHVAKTVRVPVGDESTRGIVRCPEGFTATGGGTRVRDAEAVMVERDAPTRDGRGWEAYGGALEEDEGANYTFTVTAVCAKGSLTEMPAAPAGR